MTEDKMPKDFDYSEDLNKICKKIFNSDYEQETPFGKSVVRNVYLQNIRKIIRKSDVPIHKNP